MFENSEFSPSTSDFAWLLNQFIEIISFIIPVIFILTLIVILWGLTRAWILGGGDEQKIQEGKNIAVVGIIALVVMSAFWGIVALVRASIFG